MDNEKVYYIIREDVLPEAVKKTIIMKSFRRKSKIINFGGIKKIWFK